MWIPVSKALAYVASPLPFAILLVLFALFIRARGYRRTSSFFSTLGMAIVLIASLPVVSGTLVRHLESQYPPVPVEESPGAAMAVILGGAIGRPVSPRIAVELVDSSDRVLHAFRLYKAGKVPLVFLSAGNIDKSPEESYEAEYIASLLMEWGVPRDAIHIATNSRTTRENALEVMSFLNLKGKLDEPVLLVTSAMHMPRAIKTFEAEDIFVVASTTDVSAGSASKSWWKEWLPSASALSTTSRAWHEILGEWVYRMRGWV